MSSLNRKIQPDYCFMNFDEIKQPEKIIISGEIPLYVINAGTEDIVKLQIIFDAGSKSDSHNLTAVFTNLMLCEGTKNRDSKTIAEELDYYGAYLQNNCSRDFADITLFTLGKYFAKTFEIITDMLNNPSFPADEFSTVLNNKKQKFIVDEDKVRIKAAKKFSEVIFGSGHVYGRNARISCFGSLGLQQLKGFFKRLYSKNNCRMIISGNITADIISIIENNFFLAESESVREEGGLYEKSQGCSEKKHFIPKDGVSQSAIRIGKTVVNKNHPDYPYLQIVNTVLGGYFGSRLMANLREDKGYTYGIGSAVVSHLHEGYFTVAGEVGAINTVDSAREIYYEIERLQNEIMPLEELDRVKNYMLGEYIRLFDGPLAVSETFRAVVDYGLDMSYYTTFRDVINNITPEQVRDFACKYLDVSSLYEVISGKC